MFKRTAQGRQAHSRCCAAVTTSVSRTFSSSQTDTLSPLDTHSPSPPPAPEPQHLLSVSMHVTPLGTSYKWILQHLSFCDWPTSLSIMSSRSIHVAACVGISFLFKARLVPGPPPQTGQEWELINGRVGGAGGREESQAGWPETAGQRQAWALCPQTAGCPHRVPAGGP